MKYWQPDEIFSSADFPRPKPNAADSESVRERSSSGESPAVGAKRKPDQRSKKGSSSGSGIISGWAPQQIDSRSAGVEIIRGIREAPETKSSPQQSPPQQQQGGTSRRVRLPIDRDLRSTLLLHLEKSAHLLRRWYWLNATQAGPVKGERRIYIILSMIGKEGLMPLFALMTPKERRQMVEILKSDPAVSPREIAIVRDEFLRVVSSSQ